MTMARKGGGYHESIEGLKVIRGQVTTKVN